jgi:hypothetical protein
MPQFPINRSVRRSGPPLFRGLVILIAAGGLLAPFAIALRAQVPEGWRAGMRYQREMVPERKAGFMFCRLQYQSIRSEPSGIGWSTDYPLADRNLMLRLGEFTTALVNLYEDGEPAHAIVQATDPELFHCPFLFGSDAGTAGFSDEEADLLGQYLLKGGFLWIDDFWGDRAMSHWLQQMSRVLPGLQANVLDMDHPIFSSFYFLDRLPQIPNIQFWRRSGGQTSERGLETETPTMSAITDESGRILVLMTHNTDIADGWERESEDHDFFARFSPPAYAVGVNVLVYAMTR